MLNFKELLKNPSYLAEQTSAEKDPVTPEQVTEALDKAVESNTPVVEALLKEDVSTYEFSDVELLKEAQSVAVNHFGEWNKEAAQLSLAIYLESEGTVTDKTTEDVAVDVTKLFGEGVKFTSSLTNKEYNDLPKEGFADSKNKSYPVYSLESAVLSLSLGTEQENVKEMAEKFGITSNEGVLEFKPFSLNGKSLEVVTFSSKDTQEQVAEKLESVNTLFPESGEIVGKLAEKFHNACLQVEASTVVDLKPEESALISLSNETVVELLNNKLNEGENTRTLYSITRKLKISKEEIAEATSAYKWASTAVLEKLYGQLPDKRETQSVAASSEVISPVNDFTTVADEDTKDSSTTNEKLEKGQSMLTLFQTMNKR